jgi:thioesterase domain-containing protein
MVSALCEKQPCGPYYLCGYCRDGIFAYEVARQLMMYGHEVGLLALIEARNPSPQFTVRTLNGMRRAAVRFAFQLDQLYRFIRTREVPHYVRARREELKRFLLRLSSRFSHCFQLRARNSAESICKNFFTSKRVFQSRSPWPALQPFSDARTGQYCPPAIPISGGANCSQAVPKFTRFPECTKRYLTSRMFECWPRS